MANSTLQSALQGHAALAVWGSVSSTEVDEAALNDWWTNEHLPERMSIPGFLRARRYMARDEAASEGMSTTRYLTIYETRDLTTLTSPDYMAALENPTLGTRLHISALTAMNRAAFGVVHSERRTEFSNAAWKISSALMGMMDFILPETYTITDAVEAVRTAFAQWAQNERSLMSCSLLMEDANTTAPGSESQSYLNANLAAQAREGGSRCMLLLEFAKTLQPLVQDMGVFLNQSPFFDGQRRMRFYQFIAGIGE